MDTFHGRVGQYTVDRTFFTLDTDVGINLPDHFFGRRLTGQECGQSSDRQTHDRMKALAEKSSSAQAVFSRIFYHRVPLAFCLVSTASGFWHPGSREQILQGRSVEQDDFWPEREIPLQPKDNPVNARPLNREARRPSFKNSRLFFFLRVSCISIL
jgi:hypothetical protein